MGILGSVAQLKFKSLIFSLKMIAQELHEPLVKSQNPKVNNYSLWHLRTGLEGLFYQIYKRVNSFLFHLSLHLYFSAGWLVPTYIENLSYLHSLLTQKLISFTSPLIDIPVTSSKTDIHRYMHAETPGLL